MSVLVRGMDMPKTCNECRFSVDGWCYAAPFPIGGTLSERPENCPLVESTPFSEYANLDEQLSLARKSVYEIIGLQDKGGG